MLRPFGRDPRGLLVISRGAVCRGGFNQNRPRAAGRSDDVGLAGGAAELGLEVVEVAALVGLADVLRVGPAVAALEAGLGFLPVVAAGLDLAFGDSHVDPPVRHVAADNIAGPE